MITDFEKFFPEDLILETDKVKLRKLKREDREYFLPIAQSKDIWTYFTKELNDPKEMATWVEDALLDYANARRMPFAIINKSTNEICGSTSFGNISFYDKRIEIGWSWLGNQFMSTGINRHAKFCLLQYAFETLKFERVEIKTDNLNERAKRALVKIGAKPEGVLRSHMQMHSNRRRDTIYYSILKNEWKELRQSVFNGIISKYANVQI